MAQFRVHENPNTGTRDTYPYLPDIQNDLLSDLRTTVVLPLTPRARAGRAAINKLCPEVQVQGETFIVLTPQIAGIDRQSLGAEIEDLSAYRSDIIAALDFIISGI
ncbi:MAG: plasmid maintenance protein CcdB [Gammaproteobacteria bacterium]|nr:MAG: plasmid maintenance protein CcdB [Gammaproteobacteria bacterium]